MVRKPAPNIGQAIENKSIGNNEPAEPKTLSNEGPGSGNLVALLYEDKRVVLWGEGHQSAEVPKSDVRFSPSGFEWSVPGGTRVLGTGGASYYRFGESNQESQSIEALFANPAPVPEGFEVKQKKASWTISGGSLRSRSGCGSTQKLKLGPLSDSPHVAVGWMTGKMPNGQAAPDWTCPSWTGQEKKVSVQAELPASVSSVSEEKGLVGSWKRDLAEIRNVPESEVLSVNHAATIDLDRDDKDEAVLCVSGGQGRGSCYVVDMVGSERRYFALDMAGTGDVGLLSFTVDDVPYVAWVGPLLDAHRESTPSHVHVIRFDGGGYVTDKMQ